MTVTDVLAWWGAVVATVVLVWDIFKWFHEGPQMAFKVRPEMCIVGDEEFEGKRFLVFDVANIGGRATTLTSLGFVYYANLWQRIRRKADYYFVKNPGFEHAFPHKLDVGELWTGRASQTGELDRMLEKGFLYASVYCSHSSHPMTVRVQKKSPVS